MSVALGIRFLAGRYHATPWNRQVNEADVEWPPAPLRLLRALVATWHRKADRERYPDGALAELVGELAGVAPVYRLPPATLAHSRHYMPRASGKTTLVFDAFLRLDPNEELLIIWPDLTLSEESAALLGHLAERLGYLGRAESWAECRIVHEWTELPNSGPADAVELSGSVEGESVVVPAVLSPEAYSEWREEALTELGIPEKPRRKRDQALKATLPDRLLDVLRLDTGEVRSLGWSRMPGTVDLDYVRPRDAFRGTPITRRVRRKIREVDTVRLALLGRPLPRFEDAVRIGEVVRLAAMSAAGRRAEDGAVPPVLSGHAVPTDEPHQHAFYLPEDRDGDGWIDHVTVHAPAGLEPAAAQAVAAIDRVYTDPSAEWRVLLVESGAAPDFADHPYLATARVWTSVTPYLHPWFRKRGFGVVDQIRRELGARGHDRVEVEHVEAVTVGGRSRRPVEFRRFRRRRGLAQPDTGGSFWRLTFPAPVAGPVALGFGCHFGLGLFRIGE